MSSSHSAILDALDTCPAIEDLAGRLPGSGEKCVLGGAVGSSGVAAVAALHRESPDRIFVLVAAGPTEAAGVEADVVSLLGDGAAALFPQRETLPYEAGEAHLEIGGLRVEAAEAVFSGRCRLLVTTLRALQERTPVPRELADLRLPVRVGTEPGFQALQEALEERGFERVPLVEEVGQYAVRGGILDLFSFGSPEPVRVEFWGDEIVSIRRFDILDQRSTAELDEVHVLPVDFRLEDRGGESRSRSLLELLPRDALLVSLGPAEWPEGLHRTWEHVERLHEERARAGGDPPGPGSLFLEPETARSALEAYGRLVVVEESGGDADLEAEAPPAVERDMDRLQSLLREGGATGVRTLILCDNEGQAQRMEEILGGVEAIPPGTQVAIGSLAGGFTLSRSDPPVRVLTDHEIFRRSRRLRRERRFRGAVSLERLAQLTPGEYVVHMDHG
ncbi:MAG: hypothetical protein GWM92_17910, partial [Gemmatimonadetes bacterium]|nr:hypothetical protein [Gemmatimonadota bacterium]NIR80672.1 hypothetical protein [Gemmatimonadota bacterium]NIT89463.1 hypothetical protein [Gemmatimonadota bacterium]NIU33266.1 hypothetical protein [Gemmatimonadota bacterium]NIU37571.1 hypothetical protein [Gemmatimonadota bacterium]